VILTRQSVEASARPQAAPPRCTPLATQAPRPPYPSGSPLQALLTHSPSSLLACTPPLLPLRPQIRRLEALARSPVYDAFGGVAAAAPLLRAFGAQRPFLATAEAAVADHTRAAITGAAVTAYQLGS
jgi:hypothetical protein